jgi:hypothetical protein
MCQLYTIICYYLSYYNNYFSYYFSYYFNTDYYFSYYFSYYGLLFLLFVYYILLFQDKPAQFTGASRHTSSSNAEINDSSANSDPIIGYYWVPIIANNSQ